MPELRRLRGFRDFYHNSIYSAGYYRNAWAEEVKKQFRYECEENEEIESRCEMSLSDVKRRFNTSEFGSLHYVKDAVWSFAMALRKYHKEKCGSAVGICHDMKESLETMGIFPLQFQRILRTQDCGGLIM